MSEVWSVGAYEQLSGAHDELIERLAPAPGERWLDLATGTGEIALRAAAAGARVTAIDGVPPLLEKARRAAEQAGLEIQFDLGEVEYLPYEDACFDVIASSFGLILAPDHANVAAELARVSCSGARLGFTAWRPDPKLAKLYLGFSEEPIEGREAYEWGREDHVESMLGDDFELEFVDGTLWFEAATPEAVWELFSTSAPTLVTLLGRLDDDRRDELHHAFVEHYERYVRDGRVQAPRRYLLVLGRRH
jgi:ubiquinone/menaquinone biosynthesis C-methylase UbiE